MKRKKKSKAGNLRDLTGVPSDIQQRVKEMTGQLDLALHKEALEAARAIFSHGELDANAFSQAVEVVLVAENDCKQWEVPIKAAYAGLSEREQADCADSMVAFYTTIREPEEAATFIRSETTRPPILALQMDTLLALNRLDSARTLFARCRRVLNKTHDSFGRSTLLTVMAEFCQRVGDLATAQLYWSESSELDEPQLTNALSGLVRVNVVRALRHVREGIERIEKFWKEGNDENAIMLPGNRDQLLADARKELEGYRATLHAIVRPNELCQFGVGPDGEK